MQELSVDHLHQGNEDIKEAIKTDETKVTSPSENINNRNKVFEYLIRI